MIGIRSDRAVQDHAVGWQRIEVGEESFFLVWVVMVSYYKLAKMTHMHIIWF